MKKLFLTHCILLFPFLSACTSMQAQVSHSGDKGGMYQSATFEPPSKVAQLELEDYVRELVAEMALNIRDVESTGAIAVTNFVFSDVDYQSTNELGYALADTFMMELHRFGFKTLDFKVTDYIRITSQGDFAMSRDYLELEADIPVNYVLVGKITNYKLGYKVLARIVDIKSKAILASGESLIPNKLVNMLVSEEYMQPADFALKVSS